MDPFVTSAHPWSGNTAPWRKNAILQIIRDFSKLHFCILTLYRLAPIHIKRALARRGPVDRIKSILQTEQEHFAREITADRTFLHVREDGNMAQSRKF